MTTGKTTPLIFTALMALLCASVHSAAAQGRRGVVSGQLRSTDGRPVARIRVAAMEVPDAAAKTSATSMLAGITQTDEQGRYRLEDLPPGRYYIVAGPIDGLTYLPGVKTPANAKAVTVAAGSVISGNDFAMKPPLRIAGRVVGTRTLPDGTQGSFDSVILNDVTNASLNTNQAFVSNRAMITRVAADGSFEFQNVPPGAYILSPSGAVSFVVSVSNGKVSGDLVNIVIDENDITDVIVSPAGAIAIRVVPDFDGPVPPFHLTFTGPGNTPIRAAAANGMSGQVTLSTTQSYQVAAANLTEGYSVKSILYGSKDVLHSPLSIDPGNNLIIVNLGVSSPPPWVRLSGRVTGPGAPAGASQTNLSVYNEVSGQEFKAILSPDGAFEFPRILPGSYAASLLPEPAGMPGINVRVGKQDLNLDIVLLDRPELKGRVTVDHGAQLPRIPVVLTEINRLETAGPIEFLPVRRELTIGQDGRFSAVVPEGEYRVDFAALPPYEIRSITDAMGVPASSLKVAGSKSNEISIALSITAFALTGRVGGARGKSGAGLKAVLEGGRLSSPLEVLVDNDGTFRFAKVPQGTYNLQIGGGPHLEVSVNTGDVKTPDFMPLRGKAIFPPGAPPPQLVLTFSTGPNQNSAFVRPDIGPDGAFEVALPSAEYQASVAGFLGNYELKAVRRNSGEVLKGRTFTISPTEDIELEARFLELER